MGAGQGHLMIWHEWWAECELSTDSRIAYFRKWPPPYCWLPFLIGAVWGADIYDHESDDKTNYFELTEQLGFGSNADYEKDFGDAEWLADDSCDSDKSKPW